MPLGQSSEETFPPAVSLVPCAAERDPGPSFSMRSLSSSLPSPCSEPQLSQLISDLCVDSGTPGRVSSNADMTSMVGRLLQMDSDL